MISSTAQPTFRTSDIRLAALAQATPGSVLEGFDGSDPWRLVFIFQGIPADFHIRVIRGQVTVNGRDMLAALETIHGLLRDARGGGR